MGWSDRLQQWLLRAGLIISAMLLLRFAIDFSEGADWWLAAPFWMLVIAALTIGITNEFSQARLALLKDSRLTVRTLLLAAIPLGFFASSLDCTGLSAEGCTHFCTFVKLVWIPLITIVCAVYLFRGNQALLAAITVMSFVPLVPHCVCYNPGNAWWIDRLGASPLCYGWGFVASIIAVGALRSGARLWLSVALCFTVICGATGFFVSHHYFQFPW